MIDVELMNNETGESVRDSVCVLDNLTLELSGIISILWSGKVKEAEKLPSHILTFLEVIDEDSKEQRSVVFVVRVEV